MSVISTNQTTVLGLGQPPPHRDREGQEPRRPIYTGGTQSVS